jgi:1-acyl-sn-glycerol-3-phosphate acyltransferase
MSTWREVEPPVIGRLSVGGWVRAAVRGLGVLIVVYTGLGLKLVTQLLARVLRGIAPDSSARLARLAPKWTTIAARIVFRVIGIGYKTTGHAMQARGAVVANHSSWLDIFALSACQQVTFVSKDDVKRWPVIGRVATLFGTVFIRRDPKEARAQQTLFEERIHAGDHLVFFPEGTSSDGLRVLPFKSTLFAAFFTQDLRDLMQIQPLSVIYHAPTGGNPSFYGFWGHTKFAPHFLQVLGAAKQGSVEIVFHDPVRVADFASRKDLCAHCEAKIREGFATATQGRIAG